MTDRLTHRGPDGSGYHLEAGVALGHRRLAIIDLAGGAQPMVSTSTNTIVTYNGEIYNFRELAAELKSLGAVFKSNCDTEVILNAWEHWGADCVERFRGMFAFAIWDRRRRSLFLARDRLGIKPLYYSRIPGGDFIFASELKALLAHPGLQTKLSEKAVEDYFALGYVPDPDTMFHGILKLAPGHRMMIDERQDPVPEAYWDIDFRRPLDISGNRIYGELVDRLKDAVAARLIADVPLGAFLSGGVDSSAVVALMAQSSASPVKTCSIGFDRQEFDETSYARQVVERYRTDHEERRVDPDDFGLIDRLAWAHDEPFADSSSIPTYRVCEAARRRVTVALSGDGGDETFAGYRRYRWFMTEHRLRRLVPPGLGWLLPWLEGGQSARPHGRLRKTLASMLRPDLDSYLDSVAISPEPIRRALFSDRMTERLGGHRAVETLRPYYDGAAASDPLSRIQYLDFKTYLPGDILTKVDRASMAHSLEVRVPILDHEFLGWAARIPAARRMVGGVGKHVFKKALEPHLPHDILYRDKMGFGVPISHWFRGPLRPRLERLADSERLLDTGLFRRETLRRIHDEHASGARDHAALAWALMMFEASLRHVEIST